MSRRARVLGLVAAPLMGALLPSVRAQTTPPETSACHVGGFVTVAPKLVCPFDLIEVTLHINVECPTGEQAPVVRWLHVVHVLPGAVQPMGGGADPLPALDRTILSPGRSVTVTHQVRAIASGQFLLGGAEVSIEDDAGRSAAARLQPASLVVSGNCPGRASLYLPILHRPTCVPQAQPADVTLVVDRSSSVGNAGMDEAARHVRGVLDALDLQRDRVAMVAFDQRAALVAPLGSGRNEIEQALAALQAAPGTRLERGLRAGTAELTGPRAQSGRRRVLMLISDGVQIGPGDDSTVLSAADEARALGITIFTLAVGSRPNQTLLTAISGDAKRALGPGAKDDPVGAYRALADAAACAR